jgi:hypothetical protein
MPIDIYGRFHRCIIIALVSGGAAMMAAAKLCATV